LFFKFKEIKMNAIKTVFLMTLMMVLFLLIGYLIGGNTGMTIAFIFSLIMNFGAFWFSDTIVLKMYRAKEVNRDNAPKFYHMVEKLSRQANLPMPRVYLINDPTPNAFATGRSPQKAAVAATTGILNGLTYDEMSAVMAHELAHVKNRDTLISTIAATLVGSITYIAHMAGWIFMFGRGGDNRSGGGIGALVLLIVSPILAMLLQMAISRAREFAADKSAATITGNPLGLARALEKISRGNQMKPLAHSDPATAHMFIINPLSGGGISKLFSTHPPTEERIKRLQSMAR
jgi:heat shock protein HtpX